MKTTRNLLFILLLSCLVKTSLAQVDAIPYYHQHNFNNSFFIIAETDTKSNYYIVDLSQFSSSFEKAYFNNLAFRESKLTRLDAGNESMAWYKVKKVHADLEISNLFLSLKAQTLAVASSMDEAQKQQWLNELNK